jgi:EmrB/QacA subfamily drug resistance transporter
MQTRTNPDPRRWKALFLLCAAQFIVILDTSIIGIALPAIQKALGFSAAGLQWVFNAYVIAFGGLLLLGGRLGDLAGARRIFMAGFSILGVGSLLAGIAWSPAALIAGRAVQGIGAALIAPAALTLVMSAFTDPKELSRALGFWGASAAAGGSAGVFLGGVITHWLDWRWAFLVNLPLVLAVLLASPVVLRKGVRQPGKVDYAGALLGTGALVLAVYAIVGAEGGGGVGRAVGLLAVAAALFGAFLVVQKRRANPLVPLRIFAAPNLSAGNAVMALLGAAWIPGWFFLNLYLQQVLGHSAMQGGLALLPMTGAIMLFMMTMTARMVNRFGWKKNLVAGLLLLAGALLLFAQAPADGQFVLHVLPASLLAALGMSLAYVPATMAGMSGAKPEESGLASGLINTSYQIGSALGLAAMVAISSARTAAAAASGSVTAGALNAGFQGAFLGATVIAVVAALLAALVIRTPRGAQQSDVVHLTAA